MRNRMVNLKIF